MKLSCELIGKATQGDSQALNAILHYYDHYMLLEALTPTRIDHADDPSTSWADYCDKTVLPEDLTAKVDSVVDLMQL